MAKPKSAKAAPFSISLQLGDKTFKSSGTTALDALIALPHPEKIVGKGVLTITNGARKSEQLYLPGRLKRLFYNATFQAIQVKHLTSGMK